MRFVSRTGVTRGARRALSGSDNLHESETDSPIKLTQFLRQMLRRIAGVEARTPPEGIDFEVVVGGAGAAITLTHSLKSAVRWYVVEWTRSPGGVYPSTGPSLVRSALSDESRLVLLSFASGRAVVRVEPAFVALGDP